jgi:L-fuculokinase
MTAGRVLAVLDVGKTAARVVGIDASGYVCFVARYACRSLDDGAYPHLDVDSTFDALCDGLAELSRVHVADGIVPVAHGAAAAAIADNGLAMPVMDYEAVPPAEISDDYERDAPEFAETFSPRLPAGLNLGRQMAWMEAVDAGSFSRAEAILPFAQYWAWRFGGAPASEVSSLGCHTDLWNPTIGTFSSLAVRRGWSRKFAPIRAAGETLGNVEPGLARRLGLPDGIPVFCGLHDSNAAAWRCIGPAAGDDCVLSTGTWFVALRPGGPLDTLDPALDMLANVAPDGKPVPSIRFMGGREAEAIGDPALFAKVDETAVNRVLASGATALPCFASAGGPFRGRIPELTAADGLGSADRAALSLLYVALVADWCLDRLGARGTLHVTGPFAGFSAFCGLLAALRRDSRVVADTETDGTPLGAALIARGRRGRGEGFRQVAPADLPAIGSARNRWREAAACR